MKVTLEADKSEMAHLLNFVAQYFFGPSDRAKLNQILQSTTVTKKELEDMATATKLDFTALAAQVKATTDLEDSAVLTLKAIQQQNVDLSKQLADAIAANDPTAIAVAQAAIDQFNADLATHSAALAAAIPAGTAPAPSPVPTPAPIEP